MIARFLCWLFGHRWAYQGMIGVLEPAVVVAWPCVCIACGKERGILGELPP